MHHRLIFQPLMIPSLPSSFLPSTFLSRLNQLSLQRTQRGTPGVTATYLMRRHWPIRGGKSPARTPITLYSLSSVENAISLGSSFVEISLPISKLLLAMTVANFGGLSILCELITPRLLSARLALPVHPHLLSQHNSSRTTSAHLLNPLFQPPSTSLL